MYNDDTVGQSYPADICDDYIEPKIGSHEVKHFYEDLPEAKQDSIWDDFFEALKKKFNLTEEMIDYDGLNWAKENYNAPTPKTS